MMPKLLRQTCTKMNKNILFTVLLITVLLVPSAVFADSIAINSTGNSGGVRERNILIANLLDL